MSIAQFGIALNERTLTGELRLAYMSLSDTQGFSSVACIMEWCNVAREDAERIQTELWRLGFLSLIDDKGEERLCSVEMLKAVGYFDPPPPSPKSWSIPKSKREAIYDRDGRACHYCGAAAALSIDHKTPRSRGGDDSEENLITCCLTCNKSKGTKTYDEFMVYLSRAGA
jgi:hypothetical protein